MSINDQPVDEAFQVTTNKMASSILASLELVAPMMAERSGIHIQKEHLMVGALTTALLKLAKVHDMDIVQLARSGRHFLAIGVNNATSNAPSAIETRSLLDNLTHIIQSGGECLCSKCSKEREPSLNEQTAKEILAEIEREQTR
ncbi:MULTISPECIES: hypothetical protein [unclassified Vibrio]|uniref:hypothetical protein n=1 Tax=unclassified Vibrio TaxID=2614977 RepID=UPI00126923B8|nr:MULTISPECIES: hypothetical protein [unclassified Vibrio]QFT40087.1 hypothetical protein FIU99_27225 [Vibrio sp. THAF64]QGM38032.1 hypothetical protein GGC04_27430 [Vibrio sp. THAF191d]QGN73509.1 hypothetical protein GGC03_27350 [Vibrio sp. THAF191c]